MHALEFPGDGEQFPVETDHLLFLELVALGDLEVGMVVPGRDGHHSGAEGGVDGLVFDDGRSHGPVDPLGRERVAVLILGVALVIGVHHHVLVAELCFGTRGADLERAVLERVEILLALLVFDLVVAHSRLELRVPVHDAVAAVDEAVLVHRGEHFVHATVQSRLHRVALAAPVAAGSHLPDLAADGSPALFDEIGDPLYQFLTAELLPWVLHSFLFLELLDDDVFGRDGCMIGTRDPEGLLPAHACEPNEDVFQRQHHRMTQMQLPRGIGRRHTDGEGLLFALCIGLEGPAFLPHPINTILNF